MKATTITVPLSELRDIHIHAQILVNAQVFPLKTDMALDKLGAMARVAIEKATGVELDHIASKITPLRDKYIKEARAVSGANQQKLISTYNKLVLADGAMQELIDTENEIWERQVDFEFHPIYAPIPVTDFDDDDAVPLSGKFAKEALEAEYRKQKYSIVPYPVYRKWIQKGYITIDKPKDETEAASKPKAGQKLPTA